MSRFLRLSLLVTAILLMIACGLSTTAAPEEGNGILAEPSVLKLTVAAQPSAFTTAGQVINYSYTVTNNGTAELAGPATITDNKATVLCANLNTVGDKDDKLDPSESITCAGGYTVIQTDITTGNITSTSRARVGNLDSNNVNTVVSLAENKVLTISVAASPTSYSQANQTITYTYTIKNTGTTTLGPTQFVVKDDRFPAPFNCGANNAVLAPNESLTCTATYTITTADMAATQLTNNATASGAGAGTIQAATLAITNTNVSAGGPGNNANFPRGSTVQHTVSDGEWLLQIARCYGADFTAVVNANPQVIDPDLIYPESRVSVPNVGSVGTVYGPPCVQFYTVKSGDTWDSIAAQFNADVAVLREANQDITLSAGKEIKVPVNSKGYGGSVPVVTPPPSNQPTRLNFSATNTKVTQPGNINTPGTVRYVFTGAAGQILNVKLTAATPDIALAVYGPNNTTLKALDTTTSWSGTLTANGDHFIELSSTLGAATKSYTLEVTLTTPTVSPVERVTDINAGSGDSSPSYLSVFNGQLYFQANGNDGTGAELWKYDAGLKAASRVTDINTGAGGSDPAFLTPYANMLYFRANGNDTAGIELWRYNGSTAGRVGDINAGAADSNPTYLTVFNNALYFSAKGSDNFGTELWKYDGTVASRVADINPGPGDSNPAYLAVFNNALYFSATSTDGAGTELWKYDGTNAARVADINVGIGSSNPTFLTPFNNALYFSANGNDNAGTELWKFDGTTASRAADINVGAGDSIPTYLTVFNNNLYFSANGDNTGFELWKFDGTTASRVSDINPAGNANPAYLTVYNNELYFQANANDGAGAELWKFKGP